MAKSVYIFVPKKELENYTKTRKEANMEEAKAKRHVYTFRTTEEEYKKLLKIWLLSAPNKRKGCFGDVLREAVDTYIKAYEPLLAAQDDEKKD
jgi:hypothetical protein